MRKKIILICLVISLFFVSSGLARAYSKSFGVMFGVREYSGSLPPEIKYKSLGAVEAKGYGGMAAEVLSNALTKIMAKAKLMGANAVINIQPGQPTKGEAIIAEAFPDIYTEEDFKDFTGPKEYSNSKIFNCGYQSAFNAVKEILTNELYDFEIADYSTGIIETKPIEVISGRFAWFGPERAPFPIMKLVINVRDMGNNNTEITEKYIFLKGTVCNKSVLKKSNTIFFKEIKEKLKCVP